MTSLAGYGERVIATADAQIAGGPQPARSSHGVFSMPSTTLGRWSVGLMAMFVVLFIISATVFMPSAIAIPWREAVLSFYGIGMMAVGLGAGVVGLIAVTRSHERSWMVWLPLLAGLWVVVFLLGEFLVPH